MRCRNSRSMPRPSSSRIWLRWSESFFHLRQDGRFQRAIGRKRCRIQRAGHAQDCVQVGLGSQAELGRRRAKCLDVAAGDLAVEREAFAAAALQVESQFHVSARQFLLQQAAQLHLQSIAVGGHAEVHVEKAVVHGLQRQGEARASAVDLSLYLRETGHGANGHGFVQMIVNRKWVLRGNGGPRPAAGRLPWRNR